MTAQILIMTIANIFLQYLPYKSTFSRPYISSFGLPNWFFWLAFIVLGYIALRVYLALRKDKKMEKIQSLYRQENNVQKPPNKRAGKKRKQQNRLKKIK